VEEASNSNVREEIPGQREIPAEPNKLPEGTIVTYRYVRLSMIAVIIMLYVSIAIERWHTHPGCFQKSISAYYYTPVQAIFVGALVSLGVSMVALRGSSAIEEVFLNLSGALAPMVAFVPTTVDVPTSAHPFKCEPSIPVSVIDRAQAIANNYPALLAVGLSALVTAALMLQHSRRLHPDRRWSPQRIGLGVAALSVFVPAIVYAFMPDIFSRRAHWVSAVLMFVFIIVVIARNGVGRANETQKGGWRRWLNGYSIIAGLMIVSAVTMFIVGKTTEWPHMVLWIEGTLIFLFLLFWVGQTMELWKDGLRQADRIMDQRKTTEVLQKRQEKQRRQG
jgi:hypothetical protein